MTAPATKFPPVADARPGGGPTSFSSGGPTHHRQQQQDDDDEATTSGQPNTGSGGANAGAPPSLSHLVTASLANAAAHERAILKWSREIQKEMEDYKISLLSAKNMTIKERRRYQQQLGRTAQPHREPVVAPNRQAVHKENFLTGTNPSGLGGPGFLRDESTMARQANGPGSGFWRLEDIQSIHPKGNKGRFYPVNLVKVQSVGSLSARKHDDSSVSPGRRGRRNAPPRVALTARGKDGKAKSGGFATSTSAEPATEPMNEQGKQTQLYAMYGAQLSGVKSPSDAGAALLSLPPALSATDLKPVVGHSGGAHVEVDESAAFKSPALYIDLKMRQLFHPGVEASTQSATQKAHVMAHLLDTLGELVEPDSAQAYQTLTDTIKELMLSNEYKNLIAVNPTPGGGAGGYSQPQPMGGVGDIGGKSSTLAASQASAASLLQLQKELSRREKGKWQPNGQPVKGRAEAPGSQTLSQSLANGSLLDGGSHVKFLGGSSKAEKQRERERVERARMDHEWAMKHPAAASRMAHLDVKVATNGLREPPVDFESRTRKPIPSIAFEGDASDAARAETKSLTGIQPYRSPALTLPASVFPSLRQLPAAFLEVAFSLKEDVLALTQRLEALDQAERTHSIERERLEQEHTFLQAWSTKKTLQIQLYQRSEVNLSNEIILLKNLLVDLKEEYESITEETILLEEDYLAHGLVFGGSYAMEEFRFEEEHRNYPLELAKKRREMDALLARIEAFKKDLLDIHTERDLLLTRIEVLEQAVNMMHNDDDSDEDEDGPGEDDEHQADGEGGEAKVAKQEAAAAKARADADALASPGHLDPHGYPFQQQRADDLRGRGAANTSVPSFLRFNGFFPNLQLTKQEVEVRIKEIWSLKTIADEKAKQVGGHQTGLREYFEEYLCKRFAKDGGVASKKAAAAAAEAAAAHTHHGGATSAASATDPLVLTLTPSEYTMQEFVLNFFTTIEKNFIDQDCMLFLRVILGELNEEHYRDQMKMLANFKDAIFRLDLAGHDVTRGEMIDGLIGKAEFIQGLKQFFPFKTERHMGELIAIMERDCMTAGQVDGRKILADGEIEDSPEDVAHTDAPESSSGEVPQPDPASVIDESDASGSIYTSNFLECIRSQYLVEIEDFVTRIRQDLFALYDVRKLERAKAMAATDENANSYSAIRHLERSDQKPATLTAYDIRQVLRACDLHRSSESLTDFLKRGCNEPYLSKDSDIPIERFMQNLVTSGLVHTTHHWRRIPVKTPSLDVQTQVEREAALAEEERKAALADDEGHGGPQVGLSAEALFNRRSTWVSLSSPFDTQPPRTMTTT